MKLLKWEKSAIIYEELALVSAGKWNGMRSSSETLASMSVPRRVA